MNHEIRKTQQWGDVLWLDNGTVEIGVALEFGIRIVHLSRKGMENLYYVQPNDLSDNFTKGDWRVRGGHRLWLAPESPESYCPDNSPVACKVVENGAVITQNADPWLQIGKELSVFFLEDGGVKDRKSVV